MIMEYGDFDQFIVHTKSRSSRNSIEFVGEEGRCARFKVTVTAVPEKGKANKAVLKLLAKETNIAKSNLRLCLGHKFKIKVFKVDN